MPACLAAWPPLPHALFTAKPQITNEPRKFDTLLARLFHSRSRRGDFESEKVEMSLRGGEIYGKRAFRMRWTG
jgi:hypothetical protein